MKYLSPDGIYGNPSSQHCMGLEAENAIRNSRSTIAELLNCKPGEIIFTSGATESNNLAIKGIARAHKHKGNRIITAVTEHKAVLDPCVALESEGFEVTRLAPDNIGLINIKQLQEALKPGTILVSLMHVNNETGVIQDIQGIGDALKGKDIYFHVDAAQSIGKIDIDLQEVSLDLLSCSSHKIYGPKGVGFLYIRNRPKVKITPITGGGGQEYGIRPGTLPTHQIVGVGKAIELAIINRDADKAHSKELNRLVHVLLIQVPGITFNSRKNSLPNIVNVSFSGVESSILVTTLQEDVAISSGSACTSGSIEPSHVLRGMGIEGDRLHGAIRLSFGRYTTKDEIQIALEKIINEVERIRSLSG